MSKLYKQLIALNNKVERMSRMKEKTIARNHKKVLDDLRITLSKIYENYEVDGQVSWQEISKYDRLQKLDKEVYDLITDLYKSNTNIIRGTLKSIAAETYNNTISIVEGATEKKLKGIVKELSIDSVINNDMAGLKWGERVGKHRADLIYSVKKEIKQGLTKGDTYATMTTRLKKELGTSAAKANTIVRTEGHRVFAETQKDSLDSIAKHGVTMTKKWVTSKDERVRGTNSKDIMDHVAMDGVEIPLEADFELPDGSTGYGPGLTNSKNDINCRCILVMDIITDDNKDLSDKSGDMGYNGKEETDEALKGLLESVDSIDKNNLSNRKVIAKELLADLKLDDLKISISNIDAHGQCEFSLSPEGKMSMNRFVLNSKDQRSENHSIKTLFHEAYHAKADGMIGDILKDKKAYLMVEETFAETSAHYLYKQLGLEKEIAASYAEKLTEMLPRLKQMDKFKDCTTFADFGEVAWIDRLNGVEPRWLDIYKEAMKFDHDYITYVGKYMGYIEKSKDELLDVMLDNMPNYRPYKSAMATDFDNAKKKLEENRDISSNERMVLNNLVSVVMGRIGVK